MEICIDKGNKFAAKVSAVLKEQEHSITQKVIATGKSQSNSMIEMIHQVVGNTMRTMAICGR